MKRLCWALLLGALSLNANAATVTWTIDASIEADSTDPLGIDGENLSITLLFDNTETWIDTGAIGIFLPSFSSSASITGGHTVDVVQTTPAAFAACCIEFSNGTTEPYAAMVGGVGTNDFMDLIIDGNVTQSVGFFGGIVTVPLAGDFLLPEHLMNSPSVRGGIDFPIGPPIFDYIVSGASISISVIPIPAAVYLFASGLGLLGWFRRKV